MPPALTLVSGTPDDDDAVAAAATRLAAPVASHAALSQLPLALICAGGAWRIEADLATGRARLEIDVSKAPWRSAHTAQDGPLARAVGPCRNVIDLTAGFMRDAFRLASRERTVRCYERDPVVHFLDEILLAQLAQHRRDIAARVTLVAGDALDDDDEYAECVYVDPMFHGAPSEKRAAVKKELAVLGVLLADSPPSDGEKLFSAAKRRAQKRIVVKRAATQAALAQGWSHQVSGKGFRFDVYLV